jgi:SAM-dependent methyltransferase
MERYVHEYFETKKPHSVCDVGSMDVNGCYRKIFPSRWEYVGVDLCKGKNVDLIMKSEYEIPEEDEAFDYVISGQTLEHCRNPFRLVGEMARILRSGGIMILVAPFEIHIHNYPIDCFRFLPEGMKSIIKEAGLKPIECVLKKRDTWGIGRK